MDAFLALLKLDIAIANLVWTLFLHLTLKLSLPIFYCIFDLSVAFSASNAISIMIDFEHRGFSCNPVEPVAALWIVIAVISAVMATLLAEEQFSWHVRHSTLLGVVDALTGNWF
ncbi:uncharacterized protein RHO25_011074 [Cercospora beticola]|uniref:MARVEL domain-containing protein n=1 Tax=Cercospora beticola TaxID=122368 RepID=A0ABZ0P3I6_CERBT|nr:hypothetical protein RHO25_011074 [Cercospora beticola]